MIYMGKMKQGDARPAYSLEKEAVREEIQTGLQAGVEILADMFTAVC